MALITALYAATLALIIVALAINVTVHRTRLRIPLGDNGNPVMLRMVRIHANAAEYGPLAIALMLIYELNGGAHWLLHAAGIALVAARIAQSLDMWSSAMAGPGRIGGQSATWLSIAALAIANVIKVLCKEAGCRPHQRVRAERGPMTGSGGGPVSNELP